jgi:hypothetical protein
VNSDRPNNATSPDYIKSDILAPRIEWASTLVVYITPHTKDSQWVQWEVQYAEKLGKRIVAVYAHGESGCELPDCLKDLTDSEVCGWQGDSIVDAIIGTQDVWNGPEGKPKPTADIPRAQC